MSASLWASALPPRLFAVDDQADSSPLSLATTPRARRLDPRATSMRSLSPSHGRTRR